MSRRLTHVYQLFNKLKTNNCKKYILHWGCWALPRMQYGPFYIRVTYRHIDRERVAQCLMWSRQKHLWTVMTNVESRCSACICRLGASYSYVYQARNYQRNFLQLAEYAPWTDTSGTLTISIVPGTMQSHYHYGAHCSIQITSSLLKKKLLA